MIFTFHINDISNPKAKAFLEYIKTLEFVSIDKNEESVSLTDEQILAIDNGMKSLKEKGGIPHEEVMQRMKNKYPNFFHA